MRCCQDSWHHATLNVATQSADPDSPLAFYRRALAVRQASPSLQSGDYAPLDDVPDDVRNQWDLTVSVAARY